MTSHLHTGQNTEPKSGENTASHQLSTDGKWKEDLTLPSTEPTVGQSWTGSEKSLAFQGPLPWVFLTAVCSVLFFFQLGSYPLFDMDEPRYAEAAREMLVRQDYITPYFNEVVRFDKPVFFYWLIAMAYKIFGVNEFSARLFSAISASSLVLLTFGACRAIGLGRAGFFSALVLASCLQMIGLARMSITDMTLCAGIVATVWSLFFTIHTSPKNWLWAGFFSGIAVLTKGPVGIVLPGLVALVEATLAKRFKQTFLTPWFLMGLGVCVAMSLPWYVAAYQQNGQIFLDALFLHNVTRYQDVVSGHSQPPYFYYLVVVAGFFPWTFFLPTALSSLWASLRTLKTGALSLTESTRCTLGRFALCWALVVFTFYNVADTKLLTYILPMFPAFAILVGLGWDSAATDASTTFSANVKKQPLLLLGSIALTLGLCVLGPVMLMKMGKLLPREAATMTSTPANAVAVAILMAGSLLTSWLIFKKSIAPAFYSLVLTMMLTTVVAITSIVPAINNIAQGPMLKYLDMVEGKPLATYEIKRPSLTFYAQRRIETFDKGEFSKIREQLKRTPELYVITKSSFIPTLREGLHSPTVSVGTLDRGPRYSLLAIKVVPARP
jgi:4-amino-4-deoxy-L-arabinose transferase-like glycosyltransferase